MSVFPLSLAVDVSLNCICCWEQGSIPLRVRSADCQVVNGPDNALILSHWLATWIWRCHAACFCCYCCCLLFADIKYDKSPSLALVELREKMIWKQLLIGHRGCFGPQGPCVYSLANQLNKACGVKTRAKMLDFPQESLHHPPAVSP